MKFGTAIPEHLVVRAAAEGRNDEVAQVLSEIDQAGFSWYRVGDHIAHPGLSHQENEDLDAVVYGDPFTVVTWLAALNPNLHFVIGVLIVPLRNPVIVAHMASTVDTLTGGRLTLGMGAGYARQEFAAVGVDYNERFARTEDHIQALRALLDGPRASFKGKFTDLDGVTLTCRPAQEHLPFWLAGIGPKTSERAALMGDCWFPSISSYGKPPGLSPEDLAKRGPELQELRKANGLPPMQIVASTALGLHFRTEPRPLEGPADPRQRRVDGSGSAEDLVDLLNAYGEAGLDGVIMDMHTEESLDGCRRAVEIFANKIRPNVG